MYIKSLWFAKANSFSTSRLRSLVWLYHDLPSQRLAVLKLHQSCWPAGTPGILCSHNGCRQEYHFLLKNNRWRLLPLPSSGAARRAACLPGGSQLQRYPRPGIEEHPDKGGRLQAHNRRLWVHRWHPHWILPISHRRGWGGSGFHRIAKWHDREVCRGADAE